jgi:outer membrane immunogenic protein
MKKIILATVLAGLGSTAALAADMGARTPYTKAPAMMAIVSNWSGFYVGGNVGYGWGDGTTEFASISLLGPTPDFPPFTHNADPKGVIGGVQAGFNWQMGSFLAGVEADIQASGVKGSFTDRFNFPLAEQRLPWFGTLRGRVGVTVIPELLVYGTGGLAFGRVQDSGNLPGRNASGVIQFDAPASVSKTATGWVAGAGGEWMFARSWSAKIEYLHVDLGNTSVIGLDVPADTFGVKYDFKNQYNIVRAGVNYHFN